VTAIKVQKITLLGLLTAIALTIFMVEAQIPAIVPLPGVKLGLANIVTVFTVFVLGPREGGLVLAARIFLGAVFAGNFSTIFYSAAGGICAIGVTILLRRILRKNQLWVAGCLGAIAHSVGQMAMAVALLGTPSVIVYLPVMIVISMITGIVTGFSAQFLVNRGNLWKTILK
jgi:heptaprenyl diphosphate synthase